MNRQLETSFPLSNECTSLCMQETLYNNGMNWESVHLSHRLFFWAEASVSTILTCLNLSDNPEPSLNSDKPAAGQWASRHWNKAIYFSLNVQEEQSSMIWQTMNAEPLQNTAITFGDNGLNFIFYLWKRAAAYLFFSPFHLLVVYVTIY